MDDMIGPLELVVLLVFGLVFCAVVGGICFAVVYFVKQASRTQENEKAIETLKAEVEELKGR